MPTQPPVPPTTIDRLDADPFFARIRSLDLECPRCGTVFVCQGKQGPFDRRTGRFDCPECSLKLAIGVIAYHVTSSPGPQLTPPDWTPNPRQALAIRNHMTGQLAQDAPGSKVGWKEPHNLALRPRCRCALEITVHPACPVHGSARSKSGGESPPK